MKKLKAFNYNYIYLLLSLTTLFILATLIAHPRAFRYFTIQSNIILIVYFFYLFLHNVVFKNKNYKLYYYLSLATTFYMMIVILVYWGYVFLLPVSGTYDFKHIWIHIIMPAFTLIHFFKHTKVVEVKKLFVNLTVIYPALYLIYIIYLFFFKQIYVYPFLNPSIMATDTLIITICALVVFVFYLLLWLLVSLHKYFYVQKNK